MPDVSETSHAPSIIVSDKLLKGVPPNNVYDRESKKSKKSNDVEMEEISHMVSEGNQSPTFQEKLDGHLPQDQGIKLGE